MTATIPRLSAERPRHAFGSAHTAGAAQATAALRVNAFVRVALYAYVLSIPFEWPTRTIPIEIPTLVGTFLLVAALVQPSACFRRVPAAVLLFVAYLWVLGIAAVRNGPDHPDLIAELFVWLVQVILLFWIVFNLLADERALRGVLLALVAACTVRAALQLLGVAATVYEEWTGGERVTILGQNANLSAMILAAGLAAVLGLHVSATGSPLRKLGIITWPIAAVLGAAIIQTGSRGGLLSAGVAGVALLFSSRTSRRRLRNGVLVVVAVVLLGWGASRSEVMRGRFEAAAEAGQLAGRERIYPKLLEMFAERPVLGWGPIDNQFEVARRINTPGRRRTDAHNLVLEVLTTSGLVGTLPFLAGIALCLRGAWRARRGPLGVVPLAILAAVLTNTVTGTWVVAKIVWLALAIALAAGAHWTPDPAQAPGRSSPCAD